MTKVRDWVVGRWLIESMDQWDRDFIIGGRDGKPAIEFSWDGCDEMDPAQGRDWLIPEGDDLRGMFFIHLGDESGIVLTREPRKKRSASRRRN